MQREQWGSRYGFIIAAMGSAIGLGNLVRYPSVVYENGAGAFLIPYLSHCLRPGSRFCFWNIRSGTNIGEPAPGFTGSYRKSGNGLVGGSRWSPSSSCPITW